VQHRFVVIFLLFLCACLEFLKTVAQPHLERLTIWCAELGKPWTDFYSTADVTSDWY
jgi:hypothetical protein